MKTEKKKMKTMIKYINVYTIGGEECPMDILWDTKEEAMRIQSGLDDRRVAKVEIREIEEEGGEK